LLSLVPASLAAQGFNRQPTPSPNAAVTVIRPPNPNLTYARDVAPIIQTKCEGCHRVGTVTPMTLQSYEEVKAWAPLIKDRVAKRIMPPWPIDKTVGIQKFKNDISLTEEQINTIVDWVDAGAPLGNPADLPAPMVWDDDPNRWPYEDIFGRPPDLVIHSPEYLVVANGMDQWPVPQVDLEDAIVSGELTEERWIQAIGTRPADPGTRYVFHHANSSLQMPGEPPSAMEEGGSTKLIDSAVGSDGAIYPDGHGRVIRPGSKIRFNLHYHPYTEDVVAQLELGIWFYPKGQEPRFYTAGDVQLSTQQGTQSGGTFPMEELKGVQSKVRSEGDILIPPNSVATFRGYHVLDRPTVMNGLRGHMHIRGKYQIVEAIYPDGRWEVLSKLNWDHGWHTLFMYEEDVMPLLPKGTTLLLTSVFDNTRENRYNPDPDVWVYRGDRSIDEMGHVRLELTYVTEQEFQELVAERAAKVEPVASRQ
jgi:hypothetical protein